MSSASRGGSDLAAALAAVVSPRPLAWITTLSPTGVPNIAPFNSIVCLANYPPLLGLSFSERDGAPKDTVAHIESTGIFVVNTVTRDLAERMNESARECGADTDDFLRLGLSPASIDGVSVPRIKESPAALACSVQSIVPLPPSKCRLVIAQVIGGFIAEGFSPVTSATLTSVGPLWYATLQDSFTMPKTWK